jgi:type IV pilus assembly protein PilM
MFKFASKSKLGIDIGTASIKIVELSKSAGRYKLENYGLFELESVEASVGGSDEIVEAHPPKLLEEDLAWGIKETMKRCKITARDVVASIPSFNTFSTIITMPYLSEQDIAKTIPYEARKYIPIPLSEVIMDWTIINVAPPNQNQILPNKQPEAKSPIVEVFIAAVPKEETARYQKIMSNAGVNLRALELENSALIRALVGNDLSPIAIINIGGRSTSILIVDNGYERISHNYEVGGFEITKAIARSLNISLKRAEELKRSMGLKNANTDMITSAMSSLVDLIAFETRKTIHNYEDLKKTQIAKVLLVGGLANMPMFMEYFADKLGMAVSAGNPLARIIYPPPLDAIKDELNSTFTIALGLGMREI